MKFLRVKTVVFCAATFVAALGAPTVFATPVQQTGGGSVAVQKGSTQRDTAVPTRVVSPYSARINAKVDSLYRAARTAMVKDPASAIRLFDQLNRQYPKSSHTTAALYFRSFLLYRQYKPGQGVTPLREALADLKKLEQNYPNSPQASDARSLQTRICGELGQLGDSACRKQVAVMARASNIPSVVITVDTLTLQGPPSQAGSSQTATATAGSIILQIGSGIRIERDTTCHNEKEIDNYVAALNSLWKLDSANAIRTTTTVLNKRERCLTRLREQSLLILMQRPAPILSMTPIVFDAARNDPDSNVKRLATLWLLSQEWESDTAKLLHSIFGQTFRVKTTAKAKEPSDGKRE